MPKISPNVAQDSGIEYLISQGAEGRERGIESHISSISHGGIIKLEIRNYALYKLIIICMNDIWSFQVLRMKSR